MQINAFDTIQLQLDIMDIVNDITNVFFFWMHRRSHIFESSWISRGSDSF